MAKWKVIEGEWWEGTYYEVSDEGQVRLVKPLKSQTYLSVFPRVQLRKKSGEYMAYKVDQLVADAFGVQVEDRSRIVHKDGNPLNNKKGNLK